MTGPGGGGPASWPWLPRPRRRSAPGRDPRRTLPDPGLEVVRRPEWRTGCGSGAVGSGPRVGRPAGRVHREDRRPRHPSPATLPSATSLPSGARPGHRRPWPHAHGGIAPRAAHGSDDCHAGQPRSGLCVGLGPAFRPGPTREATRVKIPPLRTLRFPRNRARTEVRAHRGRAHDWRAPTSVAGPPPGTAARRCHGNPGPDRGTARGLLGRVRHPATLVWYINPDTGGQAAVAENCSTDALHDHDPGAAPGRQPAARSSSPGGSPREDPSIDLMSIDPPFTAEFANAGFLAPDPADRAGASSRQQSFKGAVDAATWDGKLVVAPFWSNTQVLWYRKSFAAEGRPRHEQAGHLGPDHRRRRRTTAARSAVQANKYEGYVVWINALIAGAGGSIVDRHRQGRRRQRRRSTPPPATTPPTIIEQAGALQGRAARPVGRPTRARPVAPSARPSGAFMVNWTYICAQLRRRPQPDVAKDIGYARYPQTSPASRPGRRTAGSASASARTPTTWTEALQAVECITSPENQGSERRAHRQHAGQRGRLRRTRRSRSSTRAAARRCSSRASTRRRRARSRRTGATSPARSRAPGTRRPASTPARPQTSATFIEDVLQGRRLL